MVCLVAHSANVQSNFFLRPELGTQRRSTKKSHVALIALDDLGLKFLHFKIDFEIAPLNMLRLWDDV